MAEFGSSDSGASLGDILGAALSKAQRGKSKGEKGEKPAKGAKAGEDSEKAEEEESEEAEPAGDAE